MAQYSITEDGKVGNIYSRYTRKGVPTLTDVYPDNDENNSSLRKKRGVIGRLRDAYGSRTKAALVRKIFGTLLFMIFERVAKGDVFILPGRAESNILLKKIPDDEVRLLRKRGKFEDVNIYKSNFTLPRFVFDFGPYSRKRDLQIHVPARFMDEAKKNVEDSKIPFISIRKQ